jgi:hypothetical protein
MKTLEALAFYGIIFLVGALIAGIGGFLFRHGHEYSAVAFMVGATAVATFIYCARRAAWRHASTPPEEACAREGADLVSLRGRT